jgi:hypothetical protein
MYSGSNRLVASISSDPSRIAGHIATASLGKAGKVGQGMAEAKGINPDITTEVTEEVKEITAEVVEKILPKKGAQLVSLRETISSEGFEEKRGWRRIMALWGSTNSPFYR